MSDADQLGKLPIFNSTDEVDYRGYIEVTQASIKGLIKVVGQEELDVVVFVDGKNPNGAAYEHLYFRQESLVELAKEIIQRFDS